MKKIVISIIIVVLALTFTLSAVGCDKIKEITDKITGKTSEENSSARATVTEAEFNQAYEKIQSNVTLTGTLASDGENRNFTLKINAKREAEYIVEGSQASYSSTQNGYKYSYDYKDGVLIRKISIANSLDTFFSLLLDDTFERITFSALTYDEGKGVYSAQTAFTSDLGTNYNINAEFTFANGLLSHLKSTTAWDSGSLGIEFDVSAYGATKVTLPAYTYDSTIDAENFSYSVMTPDTAVFKDETIDAVIKTTGYDEEDPAKEQTVTMKILLDDGKAQANISSPEGDTETYYDSKYGNWYKLVLDNGEYSEVAVQKSEIEWLVGLDLFCLYDVYHYLDFSDLVYDDDTKSYTYEKVAENNLTISGNLYFDSGYLVRIVNNGISANSSYTADVRFSAIYGTQVDLPAIK